MNVNLLALRAALPTNLSAVQGCLLAAALVVAPAAGAQRASALNNVLFEAQPLVNAPSSALRSAASVDLAPGMDSGLDAAFDDVAVEDYLQSIAATELADGPYAPALLEQYLDLGESYQRRGEHEEALAAFEKADYISRINNGLYSPEQFVIVENMIESHLARDELFEAGEKERYLLLLQEQHYGENSLELVPALADTAEWNFSMFNRQLTLPNTVFSMSMNQAPGARDLSPRAMAFGSLFQSQANYWRAINIMLSNGQYGDPQLPELERKLIETAFLSSYREGLLESPDFYLTQRRGYTGSRILRSTRPNSPYYFTGRSAYERLMAYHVLKQETDAMAVARTLIALGDWHLLFDHQGTAIKTYRRAHDFLVSNQVPQEAIDTLFSPAVPQQLPAFTPLPNSREKFGLAPEAEVAWDGYMDVSFRVSRFGQVQNFEVLDRTGPVTEEMEKRLRRVLRSSPFRPRFIDGMPARRDEVTLRYYYTQID